MVPSTPRIRRSRRARRRARGFSLIELGIVIAVIAVLAAVVIFGRGFITAARVTKAVEASNTVRKGASTFAGLLGGTLRTTGQNQLAPLQQRGLLPALTNGVWVVAGSPQALPDAIQITNVRLGQIANPSNNQQPTNAAAVTYATPAGSLPADIFNSVADDSTRIKNGATVDGSPACANAPPPIPSTAVTICFFL